MKGFLNLFLAPAGLSEGRTVRTSLSTYESLPLKGRYILESVAIPKRKITLNKENFNKLLVTDVTLGVPNQTIYSSILPKLSRLFLITLVIFYLQGKKLLGKVLENRVFIKENILLKNSVLIIYLHLFRY